MDMNFPSTFYEHLLVHNYTEIKGGKERETFLEIWVVAVGERVFARSWNKSERSWFTEFLKTGVGQLKHSNAIYNVTARKIMPGDAIHQQINAAYLSRYNQKDNIYYAEGISQKEYEDYTLEFFFAEN